jgi:UDP-2,3-diacylglucosamine pyrophosphatase LpxH
MQAGDRRDAWAGDIVVVSDLHFRSRDPDPGRRDVAFAAFVRSLPAIVHLPPASVRLILLGDTFDLPTRAPQGRTATDRTSAWAALVQAELATLTRKYPGSVEALGAWLRNGGSIDVVAGNHDMALQLPAVATYMRDQLRAPGASLRVVSWIVYERGRLYAEHGHQYHDLAAVPLWLEPGFAARDETSGAPLLRGLDEGSTPRFARDLVRFVLAPRRLAASRRGYRNRTIAAHAEAIGLPIDTLTALDRLSETTMLSVMRRLILRTTGDTAASDYLLSAAERINRVLAASGHAVPVTIFGHSHTPGIRELRDAPDRSYANAGSWATLRPQHVADSFGPGRYPFLWLARQFAGDAALGDSPAAPVLLLAWDAETGRALPIAP